MAEKGFQSFGFGQGDDKIGKGGKVAKFKAKQGETYRISFLNWPGLAEGNPNFDAETPLFEGDHMNFIKGVGRVLNRSPEHTRIAGEPPKLRIIAIIVVWPVTKNGQIDAKAIQNGDVEVMLWDLPETKYADLKPIHMEWHFGSHDIRATCTKADWQEMTFTPSKDSLLRKVFENDTLQTCRDYILSEGQALLPKMRPEIGREMSVDQIREKLAGSGGGGASMNSLADPGTTDDIDGLVDDLLG